MEISLDDYLNQCRDKWKGKDIKELPAKYLNNIRVWIMNKCKKEGLNYRDYSIFNNIEKELDRRDDEEQILVYDKNNLSGHGTHYYVDKEGNYIGTVK